MSEAELEGVAEALADLEGAPLTGVWQPRRDRVVLGLGEDLLLLVPRGPDARLHTVCTRPRASRRAFSFQGACRAHLAGALVSLTRWEGERAVDLDFGEGSLHLRLTGRSGGLWLLRGHRVIAAYDGPAPESLPALPPGGRRRTEPRFAPAPGETWDLAARRWFGERESHRELEARRGALARRLRTALAREQRLGERLAVDLRQTSEADALRRQADALAAHLHRIPQGHARLELPDPGAPGEVVAVRVDPAKPPAATMNQLYRRARRLRVARGHLEDRLEASASRMRDLQAAMRRVESASRASLAALDSLVPPTVARRPGEQVADRGWSTWVGPRGQRVLVGRDAKGNRRLTFQVARGHDWWMHLRDQPGAHLVIPCHRGSPPPLDTLLAAAQIALIHARIPEGVLAEVQYTRAGRVRSIRGDAGGRVIVHDERVLSVRREDEALEGWSRED